jgi:hypothetical protein
MLLHHLYLFFYLCVHVLFSFTDAFHLDNRVSLIYYGVDANVCDAFSLLYDCLSRLWWY